MRVYLQKSGTRGFLPIAGPGDLVGKSGTLRVVGPATERSTGLWSVAIGNFVVSGGSVQRRESE
jgi:hypothetical protein